MSKSRKPGVVDADVCVLYSIRFALSNANYWIFIIILPVLMVGRMAIAKDVQYSNEYALTYDDNVNRAGTFGTPKLADSFISYRWNRSRRHQTHYRKRHINKVYFGTNIYDIYSGLSKVYAGVSRTYQKRRSGSFGTPTYSWFADSRVEYFPFSATRNGLLFKFGAARRKLFTDRISFYNALTGRYKISQGAVFDTLDASLLFNLDYILARRKTLYVALDIRRGDIVSSADPSTPAASYVITFAQAIENDTAFANQFAYRLDASTLIYSLGYNQAIGNGSSFDFSLRAIRSIAVGGFTYDVNQFSFAYLKQL